MVREHRQTFWFWLRNRLWLTLPLLALPALWPFYSEGLPRSFDGAIHLQRIALLGRYLEAGDLFPRWAPDLQLGFGYPVFSYYASSTYYLTELIHRLGLGYPHAFIAAFALLVLAAGGGAYAFASDSFGNRDWPALVTAVAYIYSPYLLTNVYMRGAIAEVGALALLPWLLWSARRLLRSGGASRYVLPLVLTLGGLAVTHNITLLFVPPLLLGFMLIHWWLGGRNLAVLGWAALAGVLAVAISAFFWLPLIVERPYLADTAYTIAKSLWLPRSIWTWDNFLDAGWTYDHSLSWPVRLGLGQLLLAGAGFILARRRDPEWLWLCATTVVAGLLASAWALPLWQSNDILPIAQFPWRLLSIMSLPLALFTGGLAAAPATARLASLVAAGAILLVIFNQTPRLHWIGVFDSQAPPLSLPVIMQSEIEKGVDQGGQSNSSVQEFRPRWADQVLLLDPATVSQGNDQFDVDLTVAGPRGLDARLRAKSSIALRFTTYYFPGWSVWLDGIAQRIYPSTNLGLLTVDIPAGEHTLQLRWTGTALQYWAAWASMAALVLVALICPRQRTARWLAVAPLLLAAFGLAAHLSSSALAPVAATETKDAIPGLHLLGYTTERAGPDLLYLYPYWQVATAQPATLAMRWQLLDASGHPVAAVETKPYFNAYAAANWPAASIVDDAYWLSLPDGLPAGIYQLTMQPVVDGIELTSQPLPIGPITLTTPARSVVEPPTHTMSTRFGDDARLIGYDLAVNGRSVDRAATATASIEPGDTVQYTLYWQASAPIDENYHAFVHLTDITGASIAQSDQLPGPVFQPPAVWDGVRLFRDQHLLRIRNDAPGGLVWANVGLYRVQSVERLPVVDAGAGPPRDRVQLPPLKIVRNDRRSPTYVIQGRFGDAIALAGYDLTQPAVLHAGDRLDLTLHFRSAAAPQGDYTRFAQLYNPQLGLVAQFDSQPQAGGNPTWSWHPGETVLDPVSLQVSPNAAPGVYTLYVGFYEPARDNVRLPVLNGDGATIVEGWLPLTQVKIVD